MTRHGSHAVVLGASLAGLVHAVPSPPGSTG
jgi:hypothetical protein